MNWHSTFLRLTHNVNVITTLMDGYPESGYGNSYNTNYNISHQIYKSQHSHYNTPVLPIFIKCNQNLFGNIIFKNDNGTYNIKIKQECKWYNGPQIITQITRNNIDPTNEFELKYCVEIFENNQPGLPVDTFDSDDINKMDVYYFLDEIGNYYINDFIKNGFTSLSFLLL
eukprot:142600_1